MDSKGGRYSMSISGQTYSGRASAKVMPSRVSIDSGANMDGTGYKTVKPELTEVDLTFDRGPSGIKWDEDMLLVDIDLTFKEIDANRTHLLTAASWQGKPSIDTSTGEVSGMTIRSDKYQAL